MPGLNIIIAKQDPAAAEQKLDKALQRCLYTPGYKTQTYSPFPDVRIAVVTYPDYPVTCFSDSGYDYFFEGRMYDLTPAQEEETIKKIASAMDNNQMRADRLGTLLAPVDGEFFLCIVDRKNRQWLLAGDALNRLPVYRCMNEHWTLYLRDLSMKQDFIPGEPDPLGVAETMYFGYPLSGRTIYRHTTRAEPAFFILESPGSRREGTWKTHNFETYNPEKNPRAAAEKAGELFLEACRARLSPYPDRILSLSGGLDSRVIGSALNTLKLPFRVASYLDPWRHSQRDVEVAKKIAATWGKELNIVPVKYPSTEITNRLITMKAGMNSVGMSFILDFFSEISRPGMVYITGDGGDKVLPDNTWDMQGKEISQVVSLILKKHTLIEPEIVYKYGGPDRKKMHDLLVAQFEEYPEKSLKGKYTRFLIMGRGVKWLFEGEDRNRCFFPSITPYYSVQLFDYLMAIDPAVKRNYQLYRSFMEVVSPETTGIENANWGFPVGQSGRLKFLLCKQRVKYALPGRDKFFAKHRDQAEFDFILETLAGVFPGEFTPITHHPGLN